MEAEVAVYGQGVPLSSPPSKKGRGVVFQPCCESKIRRGETLSAESRPTRPSADA